MTRLFLTPDNSNEAAICRGLQVPSHLFPILLGQLDMLTDAALYEEHGNMTPQEVADEFQAVYESYLTGECAAMQMPYINSYLRRFGVQNTNEWYVIGTNPLDDPFGIWTFQSTLTIPEDGLWFHSIWQDVTAIQVPSLTQRYMFQLWIRCVSDSSKSSTLTFPVRYDGGTVHATHTQRYNQNDTVRIEFKYATLPDNNLSLEYEFRNNSNESRWLLQKIAD